MRTVRLLIPVLTLGAVLAGAHASAQAPRLAPQPAPVRTVAIRPIPEGTDHALTLLQAYADGRASTPLEKSYQQALDKVPNARANAKRILQKYEASKSQLLGGRTAPNLQSKLDIRRVNTTAGTSAGSVSGALVGVNPNTETLPPEPDKVAQQAPQFRYEGLKCRKTIDGDANGDEPVAYANILTQANYNSYATSPLSGPQLSGIQNGATSTNGAAAFYTTPQVWPSNGAILLSALLEDNGGDAVQDKQRVDLVVEAAKIFAQTIAGDRIAALKTALDYHVVLLRIDDPARWTEKALNVSVITPKSYDDWFLVQPKTMDGVPYKYETVHDTRGGDYSLLFGTPSANISKPPAVLTLTIEKIENTGSEKDAENGLADMGLKVYVNEASGEHAFTKNKNEITTAFNFERHVFPTTSIVIQIEGWEQDAPPDKSYVSGGAWGSYPLGWCGVDPSDPPYIPPNMPGNYLGVCAPSFTKLDLTATKTNGFAATTISVTYDPATGTIKENGTVIGQKGQSIVRGGDDPKRAAKVTFKISHK